MTGAAHALFLPLALAVGFSMVASFFLSSTLVPVLSVWMLRGREKMVAGWKERESAFARFKKSYGARLQQLAPWRSVIVPGYLVVTVALIVFVGGRLGREIFPRVDSGQLQVRLRAPAGTDIDGTEAVFLKALNTIKAAVGADKIAISLGLIGVHGANFPINFVHLWNGGPEEGVLQVQLKGGTNIRIQELKERLRKQFAAQIPGASFSFEPADIINTLNKLGHKECHEAANGREAVDRLADTPVDMVITDWNMPEMSGVEFIRAVRSNQATRTLPVLMVTTNAAEDDIVEALQAGANNYVVKPFTPDTIRDKILAALQP